MRRLRICGLDALQLNALHCLGNLLLLDLRFRQQPRLLQHHLVQLIILMLQVREMRFQLFQAFRDFFVHVQA